MRPYRLEWEKRVRGQLRLAPGRISREAAQMILDLRRDPYPPESEALRREHQDLRRIKLNGWRIIYKVYEQDRLVKVLTVEPRGPKTYLNIF